MNIKLTTNKESVRIDDLGIILLRNVPQWISDAQYSSSLCVQKLEQMGLISCTRKNRSRSVQMPKLPDPKKAPIRTAKLSRPNKGGLHQLPQNNKAPTPQPPQVNVEEIARKAAEQAAEQAAKAMVNLSQNQSNTDEGSLEEKIQRAVINALSGLNFTTGGVPVVDQGNTVTGPEEPIYIPSNIVNQDIEGTLNLESETTSADNVDGAVSALKALRKSKKEK